MGAAWRRARRAAGRRRIEDECWQDNNGGSDKVPDDDGDDDGNGSSGVGCSLVAPATSKVLSAECDELSHIRWDTKFHARQASKALSADAAARNNPVQSEAAGAPLASAATGDMGASVPVDIPCQSSSRLRWHFYSNLLLSLMRQGINVKSLPDRMNEKFLRKLMHGRFQGEQYAAARGCNDCITRAQVWEFVPPDIVEEQRKHHHHHLNHTATRPSVSIFSTISTSSASINNDDLND